MKSSEERASPCASGSGLHLEQTVEVFQRGDCTLVPVADIGHIDLLRTAAQDGFFLGGDQPAADQLLKQAQDKLAFGHDGVCAHRRRRGPYPAH